MPVDIIDGKTCAQDIAGVLGVSSIAAMYDSKNVDWDKPPFVRIGDVFVSLTILGDNSWSYITKRESGRNFKVFAGRHGNVINPVDRSGVLSSDEESKGKDEVDPDLDQTIANRFGNRVGVIDVRGDDFRTVGGLKGKINEALKSGNCVILSWCYGLFTFFTSSGVLTGEDPSNPKHALYKSWSEAVTMKINVIVERDWKWVPAGG
jgi:hypothetical protein